MPAKALWLVGAGIVAAVALSTAGAAGAAALAPGNRTAALAVSELGLWAGLVGAAWAASRMYGTGSLAGDLGLEWHWRDLGWGAAASVLVRVLAVAVVVPIALASRRFVGTNTQPFTAARDHPAAMAVLVAIAVVGAPVVEELFFRGLLLRSLEPAVGVVPAVLLQGVFFGLAHTNPFYGLHNISVIASIAAVGIVLGGMAHHFKRLGPTITAHALFNLGAMILILA